MTVLQRYSPPRSVACWAFGAVIVLFGLWVWLSMPAMAWCEDYLLRPNMWLVILVGGGAVFGVPLYWILTLRGSLRQVS